MSRPTTGASCRAGLVVPGCITQQPGVTPAGTVPAGSAHQPVCQSLKTLITGKMYHAAEFPGRHLLHLGMAVSPGQLWWPLVHTPWVCSPSRFKFSQRKSPITEYWFSTLWLMQNPPGVLSWSREAGWYFMTSPHGSLWEDDTQWLLFHGSALVQMGIWASCLQTQGLVVTVLKHLCKAVPAPARAA